MVVNGPSPISENTSTAQREHADLMLRIEAEPALAEVAEAMKQYEIPPYAVFTEDSGTTYFAVGTNA
jgi:hypothetical protein